MRTCYFDWLVSIQMDPPVKTELEITGEWISTSRKAWIFPALPGAAVDCLLFLDGELYTERVKAPEVIREAQAMGSLRPMNCVYLPNVSAAGRHADYTCNERFASFLAKDVPGWIEREVGGLDRLYLCGLSLSGLQAVFTALSHPGVFCGVLSQSPSAWWQEERLAKSLKPTEAQRSCFWLSVGTRELEAMVSHPPSGLWQKTCQLDSVRRLTDALTNAGHEVQHHEYDGGHDSACWGAELPRALAWLMNH
jgi:enterochelin esterase-like enzyme